MNLVCLWRSLSNVICQGFSICGAAICRVRDSMNVRDLRKATEDDGGSALCSAPASIVCHSRITPTRSPAYPKPSRVALPMHTPLPDLGGTGSLRALVVSLFRKAERLDPTSVAHAQSPIRETNCSRHY